MKEMFIRFYGTTEDQVDECLAKLKPFMGEAVQIDVGPLENSMNAVLPKEGNFEVNLVFSSEKALKKYYADKRTAEIYRGYAAPNIAGAEFHKRKQGDPVWNHA